MGRLPLTTLTWRCKGMCIVNIHFYRIRYLIEQVERETQTRSRTIDKRWFQDIMARHRERF